ncbi:MAG: hypothetical protein AAGA75_14115 [Cyanobacteria bacterium P01_E01_bin.6]
MASIIRTTLHFWKKGQGDQIIPDEKASNHEIIRVIDESGDDYLYPATYFMAIALPGEREASLSQSLTAAQLYR